jgi:hypothetical protein
MLAEVSVWIARHVVRIRRYFVSSVQRAGWFTIGQCTWTLILLLDLHAVLAFMILHVAFMISATSLIDLCHRPQKIRKVALEVSARPVALRRYAAYHTYTHVITAFTSLSL